MSEQITMQQFSELLERSNKPIFEKLAHLECKIDSATVNINDSLISNAIMQTKLENYNANNERKHKELEDSLGSNWEKTRQLESRIIRWGGVVMGVSFCSGLVFKYLL